MKPNLLPQILRWTALPALVFLAAGLCARFSSISTPAAHVQP